jgi:hypothetical protein
MQAGSMKAMFEIRKGAMHLLDLISNIAPLRA